MENTIYKVTADDGMGGERSLGYASGILAPQYIHQFQNLYFALTGKELSLKEN